MKSDKLPAMPFYPGDWLQDRTVNSMSLDHQMLWFRMLLYMWNSSERGYLIDDLGNALTDDEVVRLVGLDMQNSSKWLNLLEQKGLFSRREDNAIYCRRMVKAEDIRIKRQEAGEKGLKARLHKQNGSKTIDFAQAKCQQNIENEYENETANEIENQKKEFHDFFDPFFDEFWDNYPKRNGKKIGKQQCLDWLKKHIRSRPDAELVLKCERNYANSTTVMNGYAKDPIRFLKLEYYKDWAEPESIGENNGSKKVRRDNVGDGTPIPVRTYRGDDTS